MIKCHDLVELAQFMLLKFKTRQLLSHIFHHRITMKAILSKVLTLVICFTMHNIGAQEICDNGKDDDGDGLTDLQDTSNCKCSIQTKLVLPNPSFEEKTCCPFTLSQFKCVKNWIEGSAATTDYLNTCGSNLAQLPIPDGNGYVGLINSKLRTGEIYKEYFGVCLFDTLFSGTEYQISFSFSGSPDKFPKIAIFGNKSCTNLPFSTPLDFYIGCPTNSRLDWVLLDSVSVSFQPGYSGNWIKSKFTFTPNVDITSIIIGPSCPEVDNFETNYYFFDNLVLLNTQDIIDTVSIVSSGIYCANSLKLYAKYIKKPLTLQWYKDSIAITGATMDTLNIALGDEGVYQVRASYAIGCIVSKEMIIKDPEIDFRMDIIPACSNGLIPGTLTVKNLNGGTPPYFLKINNNPFVPDFIFNSLDSGKYILTIKDYDGCIASDSFTILSKDCDCSIYIPSAFTPDFNNLNEIFLPIINCETKAYDLQIFNRWGEKIFESSDQKIGWDGKYQDKLCQEGVYTVMVYYIPKKGAKVSMSSTFTLLR